MKIIIVILCLLGFAMCSKSGTLISTSTNMWKLTFNDIGTSTTIGRNMTLVIDSGSATASYNSASTTVVGVLCVDTPDNYTLAASTGNAAFGFQVAASAATATSALTGWGALTAGSLTAQYIDDAQVTTTALTACGLDSNAATPTNDAAAFSITYAFTMLSTVTTCTNLPTYASLKSASWTGRCFYRSDIATASGTAVEVAHTGLAQATNVTIGASTYAIGATILAGTAYLAF